MNLIINQINYGLIKEEINKLMQKWLDRNDILMYPTHMKKSKL